MNVRLRWLGLALALAACGGGDTTNTTIVENTCDDSAMTACVCADQQIGHVVCTDAGTPECDCPPPIPPDQCVGDGDCNDGIFCNGVERCRPADSEANAIGCIPAPSMPSCDDGIACTIDRCDAIQDRCHVEVPDADADGHADAACVDGSGEPLGDDCDDADPLRYPGNPELCAEDDFDHDEDCDDTTYGQRDKDGDGVVDARCCNGTHCGGDCDDTTISRRTGQPEFCDNVDNDCDDSIDEETGAVPWYIDNDGDGFGAADRMDEADSSCIPVVGRSLLATDCNDSNASKHPAQLEVCDLRDNNCNLIADDTDDLCPYPPFPVDPEDNGGGVMVDGGMGGTCPPYGYPDTDGDGYGFPGGGMALDPNVAQCGLPAGWVTMGGDCDDNAANVSPSRIDTCDLVDNDCDGVVDQEPEASESCDVANVQAACVFGQCTIAQGATCPAPYADCDGLSSTGCETNTDTDTQHCGACNQACAIGDFCSSATCAHSPYLDIDSGGYLTVVRRANGIVGWGQSSYLVLGANGTITTPLLIGQIAATSEVSAGEGFACLRSGGTVRCWGAGASGQLGNGLVGTSATPVDTGIADALQVDAGSEHACAIRADHTVWCWGRAGNGQLGYSATPTTTQSRPVQVVGIDDAVQVSTGRNFTCVLRTGGVVSCFGEDDNGRLAYTTGVNANQNLPVTAGITGVTRLAKTSGENEHMCAITDQGAVMCWGRNDLGQLGNGGTGDSASATTMLGVVNPQRLAIGFGHTCVVESDGELWCVGANDVGQLARPYGMQGNTPNKLLINLGEVVSDVSVGRRHTCAVLASGRIMCFGNNTYGQVTGAVTNEVATPREAMPSP